MAALHQVLQLLGKLTAASAVIPLDLLTLCPLQVWLNSLLLDAKRHRRRLVRVSQARVRALTPWKDKACLLGGTSLGAISSFWETVITDAFLWGWDAVW